MVDGVPAMMGLLHGMLARGLWSEQRGRNLLDGGAPQVQYLEREAR
jgi:alpha-methylacyl-CoA racemase